MALPPVLSVRLLLWGLTFAAALPLLACLARRVQERRVWLLAGAFAVSLAMDLALYLLAAPGVNNAWVGYIGYPVQFALLVLAVAKDGPALGIGLGGVAVIAMGSSAVPIGLIEADKELLIPVEGMVRAMAGFGIAYLIMENDELERFRGPVVLYTLGCLPFIVVMSLLPRTVPAWLWVWGGYQAVRLTALLWMSRAVLEGAPVRLSGQTHTRQVHRATAGGLS